MTTIYLRNNFLKNEKIAGTIRRPDWRLDYELRRKKCFIGCDVCAWRCFGWQVAGRSARLSSWPWR